MKLVSGSEATEKLKRLPSTLGTLFHAQLRQPADDIPILGELGFVPLFREQELRRALR